MALARKAPSPLGLKPDMAVIQDCSTKSVEDLDSHVRSGESLKAALDESRPFWWFGQRRIAGDSHGWKAQALGRSTSKIVGGVTAMPPGSPNGKVLRERVRRKANTCTVVFISPVHASNEASEKWLAALRAHRFLFVERSFAGVL
jgi:hypothetical protein